VKKFGVIFVFEEEKAFNRFVGSGWIRPTDHHRRRSRQQVAALQGATSVSPGVWL
jgi:hypothetical protein